MADRAIKPKGGSEAENDNYIGEEREITVDTDNDQLRVHDGTTSGGKVHGTGHSMLVETSGYTAPPNTSEIPFDQLQYDTGGQWDTQNQKFVAATAGIYNVTLQVAFTNVTEIADYQARIRTNGSAEATGAATPQSTGETVRVGVTKAVQLDAGDEITFAVDNNSSSDQGVSGNNFSTWAQVLDR